NLGLIRSTDGAKTWDHISLQQEVDFHALTAVALDNSQFRIYGYDSATGSLRISEDTGESWRFGAEIQAIDLAAATNDPNMVYATTASGLQRSTDGGVAFTPTSPSSPLVLIESIGSGVVGV